MNLKSRIGKIESITEERRQEMLQPDISRLQEAKDQVCLASSAVNQLQISVSSSDAARIEEAKESLSEAILNIELLLADRGVASRILPWYDGKFSPSFHDEIYSDESVGTINIDPEKVRQYCPADQNIVILALQGAKERITPNSAGPGSVIEIEELLNKLLAEPS